jgi:transcription initiation factor TFIIF subunit beta
MKDLRARTNQPEAYLKEIMAEIGTFHRTGQNNNMWSLNEMFATGAPPPADAMAEGGPDEDEDDDMEEVA